MSKSIGSSVLMTQNCRIRRRMLETWGKTILGYLAMGGLVWAAFAGFGYSYRFQLGFSTLVYQYGSELVV